MSSEPYENPETKRRWPVLDRHRAAVVTRMTMIVADQESANADAIAAARTLVSAEGQNQSDEQHATGGKLAISGGLTVQAIAAGMRQQIFDNPEYLDYLEAKQPTNGVHKSNGKH